MNQKNIKYPFTVSVYLNCGYQFFYISSRFYGSYKFFFPEKTMQKLKDGAKLNASPRSTVDVVTTPTKSSTLHSEVKKGLKQISLNSKCGLESDTKVVGILMISEYIQI